MMLLIAAIIIVTIIILFSGCKTQKTVTVEAEPEKMAETTDSLRVWTQDQLTDLKVKDSLYFYNDVEIRLEKILSDKQKYVKNHAIISIDSTLKIFDVIPIRTTGVLKSEPIRGYGGINALPISFTKDGSIVTMYFLRKGSLSQKDKVYYDKNGKYIRREKSPPVKNGEYCVLDSTRVSIEYNKNKYNAKFLSGTNAKLLVVNKEIKGEREIKREAQGWNEKK